MTLALCFEQACGLTPLLRIPGLGEPSSRPRPPGKRLLWVQGCAGRNLVQLECFYRAVISVVFVAVRTEFVCTPGTVKPLKSGAVSVHHSSLCAPHLLQSLGAQLLMSVRALCRWLGISVPLLSPCS